MAYRYLDGAGALTLVTDPPGVEVLLHAHRTQNRRRVPVFERSLGVTPLDAVPVPMGSWLCVLRAEGREEVRYPGELPRGVHWHGVPPGASAPAPLRVRRPRARCRS